MSRLLVLAAAVLSAWPLTAADPPPVRPIRLPVVTPPPAAVAPPADVPVTKIRPGEWYVFDADVPLAVLASPEGYVKITIEEQSCPIKLRGTFAGGTGSTETRTFAGKYVVTVEPLASGKCELIVVPLGLKTASEIERRSIEVDMGNGPIPPPIVVPPPSASLYFMIVRPDGPADPGFTRVMANPAWSGLVAKGHSYKEKTLTEARAFGLDVPDGTIIPAVYTLRTKPNGKSEVARGRVDFPTTAEAIGKLPEGVK